MRETKEPKALRVEYQTAPIDTVMEYYASGFMADVRQCEYFIDTNKRTVVFRLTVADPEPTDD